jgi:hypothetical protein
VTHARARFVVLANDIQPAMLRIIQSKAQDQLDRVIAGLPRQHIIIFRE